jgi:hypothetical protein
VIVDVEATRAIWQAEVGAARTMLERTDTRFGKPVSLTADSAYGSADSWHGWSKRKTLPPTSRKLDWDVCELKARCCPSAVAYKIPRDLHEDAHDVARAHAVMPEYAEAAAEGRTLATHVSRYGI